MHAKFATGSHTSVWFVRSQRHSCNQAKDDACTVSSHYFTLNNPYHRLLQSLLDFAYKGKVKVNQETLAPLAVLAQRVGLCELVDVCANAIINWCVTFLFILIFNRGYQIYGARLT